MRGCCIIMLKRFQFTIRKGAGRLLEGDGIDFSLVETQNNKSIYHGEGGMKTVFSQRRKCNTVGLCLACNRSFYNK